MPVSDILQSIDDQISKLQQVRALLSSEPTNRGPGRPPKSPTPTEGKRILSPEARAKIAAAQKKRWAAKKKAA